MPSKEKTGGKINYIQNKEAMSLTETQTDHVYKAIEEGNIINTKTVTCESMTCETAQIQDDNPYKKVDTLDYRHHKELYLNLKEEERETLDIDFGLYPDVTKSRYLDIYEDVYAEMVYANKFNEHSDLSMTYFRTDTDDEGH